MSVLEDYIDVVLKYHQYVIFLSGLVFAVPTVFAMNFNGQCERLANAVFVTMINWPGIVYHTTSMNCRAPVILSTAYVSGLFL